jgi:alpha-galactosidase
MMIVGNPAFGFAHGDVIGAAVATSANSVLAVERSGAGWPTLRGGELLLPGEMVLAENERYTTPWLVVAASTSGLDGLAESLHTWQRSLPAHPAVQPVNLNVWEAVHFDHDLDRLIEIADRAAAIGVERFVLDDGWFRGRRSDRAGLGDWEVDRTVWPDGLHPLIDHVHARGMQFGLWIEPEMVNPDSDLFRAHPDWILAAAPDRIPRFHRNQLVLDLTNTDTWTYLRDRLDTLLSDHGIDYVKWDHNRDVLEAGSLRRSGAPAVHEQTAAVYRLLDDLQLHHPDVVVEFCAAGGGRIDLAGVERVQRFWTSDMTDALARQHIQRWTSQLIAPEYLGAHISAPTSLQTGRTFSLDFRAGTALFGSFGIEWDLTEASDEELADLKDWIDRYRAWRAVLHTGRVTRLDVADPAVLAHGVVATDRRRALFAHVQLDESAGNRGTVLRIPGLLPETYYRCTWASPPDTAFVSAASPLPEIGPTGGEPVSGEALERIGLWIPRRRPETLQLIAIEAGP